CPTGVPFYPVRVAFISRPQPLGEIVPSGIGTYALSGDDVAELQQLMDTVGANNLRLGIGFTKPVINAGVSYSSSATSGTFSLNPSNQSAPASGGAFSVAVSAASGSCYWEANVDRFNDASSGWIKINSDIGKAGDGTVSYSVSSNDRFSPRNGLV